MNQKDEFRKYATGHLGISSYQLDSYASVYGEYISPTVIEERQMNVAQMDVFSRLMMDRIIFLGTAINDQFTWRGRLCWFGHLRYHAVYFAQCGYDMYRYGRVDGGSTDVGRGKRQAVGAETFADHDTPASWRGARPGFRYRDNGARDKEASR